MDAQDKVSIEYDNIIVLASPSHYVLKRLTWTNITGHKVNALYWAEQGNHWKVAHFLSAWQQKKVWRSRVMHLVLQYLQS